MIITKILETSLDLSKSEDIYSLNIEDVILKHLRLKYVNKCFKSCYVLDVTYIASYFYIFNCELVIIHQLCYDVYVSI